MITLTHTFSTPEVNCPPLSQPGTREEIPSPTVNTVQLEGKDAEQLPIGTLTELITELFTIQTASIPSSLVLRTDLLHLRKLTLHNVNLTNDRRAWNEFTLPNDISLDVLELTGCASINLANLTINTLRLKNCDSIDLNHTAHPKKELDVDDVRNFHLRNRSLGMPKYEILRIRNTSVQELRVPIRVKTFVCENVTFNILNMSASQYLTELPPLPENVEKIILYRAKNIKELPTHIPVGLQLLCIKGTKILVRPELKLRRILKIET